MIVEGASVSASTNEKEVSKLDSSWEPGDLEG